MKVQLRLTDREEDTAAARKCLQVLAEFVYSGPYVTGRNPVRCFFCGGAIMTCEPDQDKAWHGEGCVYVEAWVLVRDSLQVELLPRIVEKEKS